MTSAVRRVRSRATRRADADRPFVCFAAVDWWYHNRAHSDIQLMTNLAARRPVLLVNSITMRMPIPGRSPQAWRRIGRKAKSMLKLVRRPLDDVPAFHVMTPLILPAYGSPAGRRLNSWLIAWQVRLVCRVLGFTEPDVVVTLPTALPVVVRIPHRKLIYNRSDKHSAFPEVDTAYVEGLEAELLGCADHVLYVSSALMAEDASLSGSRAHFLDHGVDIDHFSSDAPADVPADAVRGDRPCLGFFGGFDDYIIDFDLLERLATEIPEADLLLVGHATCSMEQLTRHANVSWLGGRDYKDIPAYGRCFDVALMPWLQNEWIRYCNPIKLKEYLLLGLPVVSTYFPEVERFTQWVQVARDPDAFVRLVREAMHFPPTALVRPDVSGWSWSDRAQDLLELTDATPVHVAA
jgi:hypothetical protein